MPNRTQQTRGSRRRDVDQNFGGDAAKAAAMERLEQDGTTIGVHVHFGVGDQVNQAILDAWRSGKYGFASIRALAVNFGMAIEDGVLKAGKKCSNALCEVHTPGDIDSLELLEKLVTAAVEHNKTRAITRDECGKVVSRVVGELQKQGEMNTRLDMRDLRSRFATVNSQFVTLGLGNNPETNYRDILEEAQVILKDCHQMVADHLADGCRELAESIDGAKPQVEKAIEDAFALPELYQTIGALAACRRTLRQGGAQYREQIAERRKQREGQQHHPRTGRGHGRGTHGGRSGRFHSTHVS